jgi:hypothetical protein
MRTYDGAEVVDAQGEPVGTVEHRYVDRGGTLRLTRP